MNDKYLVTIIQYLIKILESQGGSNSGVSNKLDEVIQAVSNIKISAESVNLNTDELESKLTTINTNIENLIQKLNNINSTISSGFTTTNTKQDESKNANIAAINAATNKLAIMNPTHIAPVSAGDVTFNNNVTLCNITDENITITVTAAGDTIEQSIVLTPGWNPIVVKSIKGATANTLLYGY